MFLLAHELIHLLGGTVVGGIFYLKTRQVRLFLIAVLTALLTDLDHFIDYFLYAMGGKIYAPGVFFSGSYFEASGKVYVLLHSYELALILLVAGLLFVKYRGYFTVLWLSLFIHILTDQFTYKPPLLEYLFTYRFLNKFSFQYF